jgi:uncharacterized cupredoxin-like copper-binding protein
MSEDQQASRTVRSASPVLGVFIVVMIFTVALAGAAVALRVGSSSSQASGTIIPVIEKEWSIQAAPIAPAGDVTFVVTNEGTMPHEMLVIRTNLGPGQIPLTDAGDPPAPVDSGADKISEEGSVGETGGDPLEPGETRTFTISNLAPGTYQLVCNIAGHYKLGMSTRFTVS